MIVPAALKEELSKEVLTKLCVGVGSRSGDGWEASQPEGTMRAEAL